MIRKPKSSPGRDRRLQDGELEKILEHCDNELKAFVILAIETAMRRGELHGLKRKHVKGRVASLPDTKNGKPRDVPLSSKALEAFNSLPIRINGNLWQWDIDYYTRAFHDACLKAGISDLRLHDLRHEALTLMAEKGLSVFELQAIGGHRTVQMLSKYVNLNINKLAEKLG
jgi:integrase